MYRINLCKGVTKYCIYSENGARVKGVKLADGISAIPVFEFDILPENVGFKLIEPFRTNIEVLQDGEEIFFGRVYSCENVMESDGRIKKSVVCYGELDYLNDAAVSFSMVTGEMSTTAASTIMERYNEQVGEDKQFRVRVDGITGSYVVDNVEWETTWEAFRRIMCSDFGYEMRLEVAKEGTKRKRTLVFSKTVGTVHKNPIRLSKNLKSVRASSNYGDLATRLIPLGGMTDEGKRLDISLVTETNVPYIADKELEEKYGIIYKVVVFDGVKWDGNPETEGKTAMKLKEKGQEWLDNQTVGESYKITALDLSGIDASYESYKTGDRVRLVNELMGIDEVVRITGRTLDLDNPWNSTLIIGEDTATLTRSVAGSSDTKLMGGTTVDSSSEIAKRLGGLSFKRLTEAEYKKITKPDPYTAYFVMRDDGSVALYLGSVEISGGGGSDNAPAVSAVCVTAAPTGTTAHAERPAIITDLTGLTWEQGTVTSSGNEGSAIRIRTADYVVFDGAKVTGNVAVFATDTNGGELLVDLMLFDENKTLLEDFYWLNSGTEKEIPRNTKFLRIVLKRDGNPTITPDVLGSCMLKEYLW